MRFLTVFLLGPALAWAGEPAKTADTDIGDIFNTPLDATAKVLQDQLGHPATGPAAAANSKTPPQTPAADAQTKPPPVSPPAPPVLPALPETTQMSVTQMGGLTLRFDSTPLDDVVRTISRDLDRPLHYAVMRQIRVSGDWADASGASILKDVADKYGLHFQTTPTAYVLDDNGRPISLGAAEIEPAKTAAPGRSVVDLLQVDSVVKPVPPLTGKAADRALSALSRDEQRAITLRQRLLQELKN